jgi:hypothetical protein
MLKSQFVVLLVLISTSLLAQSETKQTTYTGKLGLSTIEFNHAVFPVGGTAKITTGKNIDIFSNCSEEENPKVQKLCLYDKKAGYNTRKNIKINLPSSAKKLPKTITGTYLVNGEPVKFTLVRAT